MSKKLGLLICLLGSIAVISYPPYHILGGTHWNFIWGDIISAFGKGVPVYKHIDYTTLSIELVGINVLGLLIRYKAYR